MAFTSRKTILATVAFAFCLLLTACGSDSTPATTTTGQVQKNVTLNAGAILQHSPAGSAQLSWNPTSHALTVTITLLGLAPDSKHPAHIHSGNCAKEGTDVYSLHDVVATSEGAGASTTTINGVAEGIPATGWYINVHNGPMMASDQQAMAIACGNITNPDPKTTVVQNIHLPLVAATAPDQSAGGSAQLKLANGTLTISLALKGLAPDSSHAVDVHTGGCGNQGKVLYTLKPVMADKTGNANATTVIPGVSSVPEDGWYLLVHRTTNLATQTDSDPIACGDVIAGR